MKKIIFGIFAHPDDEAFIVAGTLLQEVQAGAELRLICLTDGAAGTNPDGLEDLGATRLEEWQKAGKLLSATSMHHLGYRDGLLNNADMIAIADRVEAIVRDAVRDKTAEIEFMAFDLNGLTGHIDHIVASRAAALAFYRLRTSDSHFTRLRLACLPRDLYPTTDTHWLFMEAGRAPEEIDQTIDARDMRGKIIEIIQAHHSQRHDGEMMIHTFGDQLGMNYFIVRG